MRIDGGELTNTTPARRPPRRCTTSPVRLDMPAAGTQARTQPVNINGTITYN
jgi:hypothetical protein